MAIEHWRPKVDMLERKDEVLIRADLPRLEQKDIDVTVEDGALSIRGSRKEENETEEDDHYHCARRPGAFARRLPLPPGVEADKIRATFKNGVLEVRLPKSKEAKGTKIEIT